MTTNNVFLPGRTPNTVHTFDGRDLPVPEGWSLLVPGQTGQNGCPLAIARLR